MRLGSPTSLPEIFLALLADSAGPAREMKPKGCEAGPAAWEGHLPHYFAKLLRGTRMWTKSAASTTWKVSVQQKFVSPWHKEKLGCFNTSGYVLFLMWGIWYTLFSLFMSVMFHCVWIAGNLHEDFLYSWQLLLCHADTVWQCNQSSPALIFPLWWIKKKQKKKQAEWCNF